MNSNKDSHNIYNHFSTAAPRYDIANRILSLGIDTKWREYALNIAEIQPNDLILDAATGTGDVALLIARRHIFGVKTVGIDFNKEMLNIAVKKRKIQSLNNEIFYTCSNIEELPFSNETFNIIFIAFGLRNLNCPEIGLKEFYRILQRRGKLIILEFSKPTGSPLSPLVWGYIQYILPILGGIITHNKAPYDYLASSIANFLTPTQVKNLMEKIGFLDVLHIPLTFGVSNIYKGVKSY